MSDKTGIEWTNATWNPLRGCTRVSEGCRNCYAEGVAARFSKPGQPYEGLAAFVGADRLPRWTGKVALAEHLLDQPLRWRKPRRIFVNSMSDLFHESVPDEWIDDVFAIMALCPQHTFQVLTKRPERMRAYLARLSSLCTDSEDGIAPMVEAVAEIVGVDPRVMPDVWPLPHIWLGVSIEDQATADERIPLLLNTPSAKRFISAEPLLGPLQLDDMCDGTKFFDVLRGNWWHDVPDDVAPYIERGKPKLDWVIVGGESGPNARPMHPNWVRSLRDQCAAAGVPFFFKQWGAWKDGSDFSRADDIRAVCADGRVLRPDAESFRAADRETPVACTNPTLMRRVGKKSAGHLLDGRAHREFPA